MARLAQPTKDGSTNRAHLEAAARMGDAQAAADLDGPECPEEAEYLVRAVYELHGRSGVGPGGLAPLSYSELEAYCRLTGFDADALEVDGLMVLDRALLAPDAGWDDTEATDEGPAPQQVEARAPWPKRKAAS